MGKALDQEMHEYFMRLDDTQKKSVIQMLKSFLKGQKEAYEPVTVEEYNRELEEAEAEFERGEYIRHAELLKQMKSWKDGK